MSMPTANFNEKFYLTPGYISEVLVESKINNKKYVVLEGKLVENDEYRLEEIINDCNFNGYDFIQIIYFDINGWVNLILKKQ